MRSPSPRLATWWLVLPDRRLTAEQRGFVRALLSESEPIRLARELVVEFGRVVRARDVAALDVWMTQATNGPLAELRDFVVGLRRDEAAVRAAVELSWSNGQTEGQVNKLKMLKRQMYGRASVALLDQRMRAAA